MEYGLYFWLGFLAFVIGMTALDLGVFHKKAHNPSFRESSTMVCIWILAASVFCTMIYFYSGRMKALEFITGYVVELTLSVDNVFVFLLIFMYFRIPHEYQHKILFWGIIGAIFMRLIMITGGIYIFQNFIWIFYIFGGLLIVSAIKIFFMDFNVGFKNNSNDALTGILKRFGRMTQNFHEDKFFVTEDGRIKFTPLFVALILVEKTDLIFALDSVPAILAITQDPYIVFTSNIFAILGLRSMYFLLEKLVWRFKHLKYGIAVILFFIGVKMILSMQGIYIPIEYSLGFIFSAIIISIFISWGLTNRNS